MYPLTARNGEIWTPVFSEEFGGPKLNLKNWTTCYWWDDYGCSNITNNELQWYRASNVSISGGALQLQARKERVAGYKGRRYDYTSGMVTTGLYYRELPRQPRFHFQYGTIEIRAKAPAGNGFWSALWLLPSSRRSTPEIDIMEVLGDATNLLENHFHYTDVAGDYHDEGDHVAVPDLSEDWHVYSLRWERDEMIWYLDGKETRRYSDSKYIPAEKMYLLMNLAVGGIWPGDPTPQTKFPSTFLIDYVRVWQRCN